MSSYGTIAERWFDDHEFPVRLYFMHPTGWKGYIRALHLVEKLSNFGVSNPAGFWSVTLFVQKELLGNV